MRKRMALVLAAMALLAPAEGMAQMKSSIDQTLKRCKDAGNGLVPGVQHDPVRSQEGNVPIGMAYLTLHLSDYRHRRDHGISATPCCSHAQPGNPAGTVIIAGHMCERCSPPAATERAR